MNEEEKSERRPAEDPLPIWFFVGVILGVYGLIILVAGLLGDSRPTVLSELRPALWWSAVMIAAGVLFTLIGLIGHRRSRGSAVHENG